MRRLRYCAFVLVLLLAGSITGCAATRSHRMNVLSQQEWSVVETTSVRLWAAAPPEDVRAVALNLERMIRAFEFTGLLQLAHPIDVVLLDSNDMTMLFTEGAQSVINRSDSHRVLVLRRPRASAPSPTGDALGACALASVFADAALPAWVRAGLETYLDGAQVQEEGTVLLGRPHLQDQTFARSSQLLPLSSLRKPDVRWTDRASASAWGYFHFLFSTEQERFEAWVKEVREGADADAAFTRQFGADERALREAVQRHLAPDALPALRIESTDVRVVRERRARPAEVHVTLAKVWFAHRNTGTAVSAAEREMEAHLTRALELEPLNDEALFLHFHHHAQTAGGRAAAVQRARGLLAEHPELGHVWMALGQLLGTAETPSDEALLAYQRARARLGDHPTVLNNLAWELVLRGRYAEALPLAQRALASEPGSRNFNSTLGRALVGLGRCEEGLSRYRTTVTVSPRSERDAWRVKLAELEAQCAQGTKSETLPRAL